MSAWTRTDWVSRGHIPISFNACVTSIFAISRSSQELGPAIYWPVLPTRTTWLPTSAQASADCASRGLDLCVALYKTSSPLIFTIYFLLLISYVCFLLLISSIVTGFLQSSSPPQIFMFLNFSILLSFIPAVFFSRLDGPERFFGFQTLLLHRKELGVIDLPRCV